MCLALACKGKPQQHGSDSVSQSPGNLIYRLVACRKAAHSEADAQRAGDCDVAGAMDGLEGAQSSTQDLCAKIKEEAKN
jgi:hypothetical protein